ncbi:hypothetical protein [Natrinema pallidum]|uniref:Uncharacterized protein n=1 Tax=Natrinema pallidum DSM 3751 TaxID=1227495 RepID=L9YGI4_9EURY|nr:hypothetical protein [Natrinema pallidum]ELY73235.1 hypothetical protein C487_17575 [Natrinema pallidum DSM 3751]
MKTYVLSERLRAEPVARSDPPTLRAASGPAGEYVVASGVGSARVDSGGGSVDLTVVVGGDATPPEIHVMPDAVLASADSDLSLEVVRGASETAVQSNIGIAAHTETALSGEQGLVWRNGEAMPTDGSSRYGEVLERGGASSSDSKKVIRTYTNADGQVTVGISNSPGPIQRARHWIDHTLPSPEVPYWLGGVVVPVLGIGRVVRG